MARSNTAARGLQVIDPILTNVARRYKSDGFIADQLVSNIPVSLLSGQYPVFDRAYWTSIQAKNIKADRAPTREVDFNWDLETYKAEEYALKVSITDLERRQANAALRLEANKVEFLSQQMALSREVRVANILKTLDDTSSDGLGQVPNANDATPSNNWDQDAATIEADIKAANLAIYDLTGLSANTIVIPYKVAYAIALQQDIRDILKYNLPNPENFLRLGAGLLPAVLHGLKVVVPQGPQITTATEGAAAPTYDEIWGDDVRILHVGGGGWGEPASLYRMVHTAPTVTRWRETDPDLEYIRELERCVEKLVAPDTVYILRDVLS